MIRKDQQEDKEVKKKKEESQNYIIGLMALLYSDTIKHLSAKFGQEVIDEARKAFIDSMVNDARKAFQNKKDKSLKSFLDWLLSGLTEGHEYEVVESKEDSVKFRFTKCPWAEYFIKIGNPEIGKFFCLADEPLAKAFNEKINFKRTMTIMDGDKYCNHHYFIDSEEKTY
ncbi:MAG: L-2-amino-thiazoline-4-carboxylic acid hydrolase [Atribacterota bacterium]|nr:L-2-amino-thiazoline-4-carboxylic acid hydrolase [Atribacterota bacterium]MDD4895591.1 L-2-amino-thiazoline-4-carboxylic acid hydrolase [Atribacterota bacterium]MDD5636842.1 L-2-amino-thiazoline-4-carboxylic acid hydrolase [Atribacterota bacterium]